jgi:hypothetical protein
VHGIKGSDTAHKEAARKSETERFVVIDGDNFLTKENFVKQKLIIKDDLIDIENSVFSWPSFNTINGLLYGNGGIKCWPTDLALSMQTHENAPDDKPRSKIDFCWDINYIPLDLSFSEIRNNSSKLQAWRAGFREGVKMSLDKGLRPQHVSDLWHGNVKRLLVWATVGSDVEYGTWAILGARMGCCKVLYSNWNFEQVRNFDYLNSYWENELSDLSEDDVQEKIETYSNLLKGILEIPEMFTPRQSKFFKQFNFNTPRQSNLIFTTFE